MKPKHMLFARRIEYTRDGDRSKTPCPHGGSIQASENPKKWPDRRFDGAHVGSCACSSCMFNRTTEWHFVKCDRKPEVTT